MELYYFKRRYYVLENDELRIFADSENLAEKLANNFEVGEVKNAEIISLCNYFRRALN